MAFALLGSGVGTGGCIIIFGMLSSLNFNGGGGVLSLSELLLLLPFLVPFSAFGAAAAGSAAATACFDAQAPPIWSDESRLDSSNAKVVFVTNHLAPPNQSNSDSKQSQKKKLAWFAFFDSDTFGRGGVAVLMLFFLYVRGICSAKALKIWG